MEGPPGWYSAPGKGPEISVPATDVDRQCPPRDCPHERFHLQLFSLLYQLLGTSKHTAQERMAIWPQELCEDGPGLAVLLHLPENISREPVQILQLRRS